MICFGVGLFSSKPETSVHAVQTEQSDLASFLAFEQAIIEMNNATDNYAANGTRLSMASVDVGANDVEHSSMLEEPNEFALKRLVVQGDINNTYGAINQASYNHLHVLCYSSEADTERAYNQFSQNPSLDVIVDEKVKTSGYCDKTYSYSSYTNWGAEATDIGGYRQFLVDNDVDKEVVVVVMDTGINTSHSMFSNRLLKDENGKIKGYSYCDSEYRYSYGNLAFDVDDPTTTEIDEGDANQYSFEDDDGHGSHVAGIVCSLTPSNVKIFPIKVGDCNGYSDNATMLAAYLRIISVYSNQYNIVCTNLSFAGAGKENESERDIFNEQCYEPLMNKNILSTTAVGNESTPYNTENLKSIVVSSTKKVSSGKYQFENGHSNYGKIVDIAAPGSAITSAWISSSDYASSPTQKEYGTSMAAPQVAGVIALLYLNPNLPEDFTAEDIEQMLYDNAVDMGVPGKDKYYGHGMLYLKYFEVGLGEETLSFYRDDVQIDTFEANENFDSAFTLTVQCSNSNYKIIYTKDQTLPRIDNANYRNYSSGLSVSSSICWNFMGVLIENGEIVGRTKMFSLSYFYLNNSMGNYFTIESGIITDYSGHYKNLTIPKTLNGYTIKGVGKYAFEGADFNSITLPESCIEFKDYSFIYCEELEYMYAPNVTKIGKSALLQCQSLPFVSDSTPTATEEQGVFLPVLQAMGSFTFYECSAIDSVSLSSLTTLGETGYDFAYCTNLKNVHLPSITSISDFTFAYCENLTGNFYINKNISSIGVGAFADTSIQSFSIEEGNNYLYTDGFGVYNKDSFVAFANGNIDMDYEILDLVTIDEQNSSITTIAGYVMMNAQLNRLTIPETITTINRQAFDDSQITHLIYQPTNCIDIYAWDLWGFIDTIEIADTVECVPKNMFYGTYFKSVIINSKETIFSTYSLYYYGNEFVSVTFKFSEEVDTDYIEMFEVVGLSGDIGYLYSKTEVNVDDYSLLKSLEYFKHNGEYYVYVDSSAFVYTDGIGTYSTTSLISFDKTYTGDYEILSKVSILGDEYTITTIEESVMEGANVGKLTIPETITVIKRFAFLNSKIGHLYYQAINCSESGYCNGASYSVWGQIDTIEIADSVESVPYRLFYSADFSGVIINSKDTVFELDSLRNSEKLTSLTFNFTEDVDADYVSTLINTARLFDNNSQVYYLFSRLELDVENYSCFNNLEYCDYIDGYHMYWDASALLPDFTITVIQTENGYISDAKDGYKQGSDATFTITPNNGFCIAKLIIDGSEYSTGDLTSYTFTNISQNHTISAVFVDEREYQYTDGIGTYSTTSLISFDNTYTGDYEILSTVNIQGKEYTITTIGQYVMDGVTLNELTIPETIEVIMSDNFFNSYINHLNYCAIWSVAGTAFDNCFIDTIKFSENVDTVQQELFSKANINNVIIQSKETSFGPDCFNNSQNLNSITFNFEEEVDSYYISRLLDYAGLLNEGYTVTYLYSKSEVDITSHDKFNNLSFYIFDGEYYTYLDDVLIPKFTITATANNLGNIWPNGDVLVNEYASQTFEFGMILSEYMHIESILVDGDALTGTEFENAKSSKSYTFENVTGDHSIEVTIALNKYTVTVVQSENGNISPSTGEYVYCYDPTFSIIPDNGYHITKLIIDGEDYTTGDLTSYTFQDIKENHTISAEFSIDTYAITASANAYGIITPNGSVSVQRLTSKTFRFYPLSSSYYYLESVLIDGVALTGDEFESVKSSQLYTFSDITKDHTIEVIFAKNKYTVEVIQAENGTITPSTSEYEYSDNARFKITPDAGYYVEYLLIDGVQQTSSSSYTFVDIEANHTISAKFAPATNTIYTVKHWQEVLLKDQSTATQFGDKYYTLVEGDTQTLTGTTGSSTSASYKSYTGFSSYNITQQTILGDGSTVVNVLYKRSSYSVILDKETGIDSVSGAGTYLYGQEVTISATLAEGYEFDLWQSLDTATLANSSDISYIFTMPASSVSLTANATIIQFTIYLTLLDNGRIDLSTGNEVDYGSCVEIKFIPDEGYELDKVFINGNDVTEFVVDGKYSIMNIKENQDVIATFKIKKYTITAEDCVNGCISPNGTTEVEHGDSHTCYFIPVEGYHLAGVEIDGQPISSEQLELIRESGYTFNNITKNHTISATFLINTYTITVTQSSNGTISSAEASYNYGSSASFTIEPNAGYHIDKLIIDGLDYETGDLSTYTFENITTNHTISAVFAPNTDIEYTVKHWKEVLGFGDAWNGEEIQVGDKRYYLSSTETCNNGTTDKPTAVSSYDYEGFTAQTIEQKMVAGDGNTVVDIFYNRNSYTLTLIKGDGIASVTNAGTYLYEEEVVVSATLIEGYRFLQWKSSDTGKLHDDSNIDYLFYMPAGDITLTAEGLIITFVITIETPENGKITPSTEQVVNYGSSLTLEFEAFEGYALDKVLLDSQDITADLTQNKYTLASIKADYTISAVFKIKTYTITAESCTNGQINPSGVAEVNHGSASQKYEFKPDDGYHLTSILVNGVSLTTEEVENAKLNGYTIENVAQDYTISATFAINTYIIEVEQSANGTISDAEASYNHGSSETFAIKPAKGYHIVKLIIDESEYTTGDLTTYTFENITTNHTISAVFAPNTDTQYTVKHWRESLPDDYDTATQFGDKFYHLATLDTETLYGTTDKSTSATAKTYTGFTVQTIEQKTIAGDESTVIDVLYTRNSYTLKLSLMEGVLSINGAVDGIYLYETEFDISASIHEYYNFIKWQSSNTELIPDSVDVTYFFTMPAGDVELTAVASIKQCGISIFSTGNGSVNPPLEDYIVDFGSDFELTMMPEQGYKLKLLKINGVNYTEDVVDNKYTIKDIFIEYITIVIEFDIQTYIITASSNRTMPHRPTPYGDITVEHGKSQTFTFPTGGAWKIERITIDNVDLDVEEFDEVVSRGSYTFENVTNNHSIYLHYVMRMFTITVVQSENGVITPSTNDGYLFASTAYFTITPDDGYHVDYLLIDGNVYTDTLTTYTFEEVISDHTISAVFAPNTDTPYTIKHWQESLTQTGATKFGSKYYTLVEDDTLHLTGITGTKIDVVYNTYTGFTAIDVVETAISGDGDTVVNVLYDRNTYKITLIKGEGVSAIGGVRECVYGNKVTLSVTMLDSHDFVQWKSSDESIVASSNISNYSFTMPASDVELTAEGTIKKFTITIEQPENGTIEPSTDQEVIYDSYLELEFKASEGYELDTVILQGKDIIQDVVNNKYIIQEIQSNYTVKATFKLKKYAITATSNANGAISPSGVTYVEHNQSQTYTFKPNMGYYLASVVVDSRTLTTEEMEQVKANGYTFEGVTSTHTIVATFAANAETPYTIKHWQESLTQTGATKIGDKYYTLVLEKDAVLPTGTLTNVVATTYEGFTAQTVEQKNVAGDGSTIIDVLYNRNTYSLTVVSGDADQISSVRGTGMYLFGQSVTVSATMKEAYQFSLWVSSKPETLANSTSQNYTFDMPAGNIRLTAQGKIKTFVITMQNPTGGQLQTQGEPIVEYGSDFEVEFVADTGYELDKVFLDDEDVTESVVNNKYTLVNVVSEHELSATFKLKKYTITVTSGEHGSITPDETKVCEHGVLYYHRYDFIPDEGYQVSDVTINGRSVGAVEFYMFNYITESKDVYVTFEKIKYTVDVTSGENGQVSPSGKVQVEHGDSKTFTITPDNGFGIAYIKLNDQNVDIQNSVTITDITTNQKLEVGFERVFFIKATSEGNGDITPSTLVISGTECTFTFTPSEGYEVKDVQVDGKSVGAVPSYTFTNVTEPHTISVEYRIKTFDVKLSIEGEGRVEADEIIDVVTYGDQRIFTINPDNGWEVHKVYVDGESVEVLNNQFAINAIKSNVNIEVVFKEKQAAVFSLDEGSILLIGTGAFIAILVICLIVAGVKHKKLKVAKVAQTAEVENTEQLQPRQNLLSEYDKAEHVETPKEENAPDLQEKEMLQKAYDFVKGRESYFVSFCARYHIDYQTNVNAAVLKYYQAHLDALNNPNGNKDI